jgi:hypothetical protein
MTTHSGRSVAYTHSCWVVLWLRVPQQIDIYQYFKIICQYDINKRS